MANKFVLRKGLMVSGSDLQPFTIQGTVGQLFSVESSSQGNALSISNISGLPIFKVVTNNILLGYATSSKPAVTIVEDQLQITGSAKLEYVELPKQLVQGNFTTASGEFSHAQGSESSASGSYSHAEGLGAEAIGQYSHAEGLSTDSIGDYSHAEGFGPEATGNSSHAQGFGTIASGSYSHAEGYYSVAFATGSHAEGYGTEARGDYSHVQGQNNESSPTYSTFIHGNGTSSSRRNLINAYGTGSDGVVEILGTLRVTGDFPDISVATAITKLATTIYNITNEDGGKELLLVNPIIGGTSTDVCTINFPTLLPQEFAITITTVDQAAYIITGSGITFINNIGNGLGMKSSVTIVNTGIAEEYLTLGDL